MKTIIWIVVIALVAVGGYSIYKHQTPKQDVAAMESTPLPSTEQPTGKKVPFSTFIKQGNGSYQCTVHQYLSDMNNDGTVYVSAGSISGTYSTIAEGKTINSSFIMKDGMQYIWDKDLKTGFKMKVSTNASGDANASANGTYQWNADQIGDYDCKPWTLDASYFTPPASISFTDLSSFTVPKR